jgi:hypothetical protein
VAIAGGDPGEELMLGTATTGHLTSVFFPFLPRIRRLGRDELTRVIDQ